MNYQSADPGPSWNTPAEGHALTDITAPHVGASGQHHASRPRRRGGVLVDAAQILLGVTFSCLLSLIGILALGAMVAVVVYLSR